MRSEVGEVTSSEGCGGDSRSQRALQATGTIHRLSRATGMIDVDAAKTRLAAVGTAGLWHPGCGWNSASSVGTCGAGALPTGCHVAGTSRFLAPQ